MSVKDTTSANAFNDVVNNVKKTGGTDGANTTKKAADGTVMGKDAFLQLLVTQLKNQNPLEPQDNGAFVAQLAQFSSLEGITTLNDSVSSLSTSYKSSQALQASSLVGRSVIVQTDTSVVDPEKGLTGSLVVSKPISNATITVTDKDGKVVKTIDMGSQVAGSPTFTWDGTNTAGEKVEKGTYSFKATSKTDDGTVALLTSLPATVNSVTLSQTGGEIMLNLAGLGAVALSKVQTIGL